ncbi:N-acetylmuramoyl-L-alanine amidase [Streptomyces sp. NPDC088794]|uniref:N-acetylmuramoyl-L-alanine amidase n=1 Tax=Streptomyces sp. NPDC088794 TaxID=3365902 RepID=UPI0037F9D98E
MATPLSASAFVAALKAEGVRVAEYPGWRTRERDDETGKPFGPVHGVLIHHTAGSNSLEVIARTGRPDLPAPLAHSHLAKSGLATMCSAGRANHAGLAAVNAYNALLNESSTHPTPSKASGTVDGNDVLYGLEIENLGNGKDPYPDVQYDAAVRWAAALCRAHGWGANSVAGHKETSVEGKVDPSFPMGQFRTDVAARLAHPASWNPADNEEPAVALTAADVKTVWLTDGVVKNPNPATSPANPFIAPATGLNNIEIVARRTEAQVSALTATVDKLVAAVAALTPKES